MIAADRSGSGKTTVTTGILRELVRTVQNVAPFKCGPDYIDTLHHSRAAGRPAHNLDTVMLSEDQVREVFRVGAFGADICVAEGVMGFFDGIRPDGFYGSSHHVASVIGMPVVLVMNCASTSYSVAATLRGFQVMSDVPVAGVILNNVASGNHEKLLKEAIRMHTDIPVLGCVPRQGELIGSRHLGIKTAFEVDNRYMDRCADLVCEYIDMNRLKELTVDVVPIEKDVQAEDKVCYVAYDKAFNFYYEANFYELQKRGYSIKKFSPLADERVDGADMVYLGGGYPELYAEDLAECTGFLRSVSDFSESGKPVLAECGGMMALTKGIHTESGFCEMAGIFDAECRMMEKRQALGYVRAFNNDYEGLVGHEFHYSKLENVNENYFFNLEKLTNKKLTQDGFLKGKTYGGYAHFHFMSDPTILDIIMERQHG
ncbi:cobyrinate a,c-diamide synthase [Deferribacteres bacterium DY0037]